MNELDVLTKELENVGQVYLYNKGNVLMAYEQSAYFLSQMQLAECVANEVFPTYEVIIATASVRVGALIEDDSKYRMVREQDSMVLYILDNQFNLDHFIEWKTKLQFKTDY